MVIGEGSQANLQVTSVTLPETVTHGENVTVSWTVENNGTVDLTGTRQDAIFLSEDDVLGPDDKFLTIVTVSDALAAGGAQTVSSQVQIKGPYTGTMKVLVFADYNGAISESNNGDNTRARSFELITPDVNLTVPQASVVLSSPSVMVGGTLNVQFRVQNNGTTLAAGSWFDHVYISDDAILDSADAQQWTFSSQTTLGAGEFYDVDQTITLSGFLTPGNKFLILATNDQGEQGESSYGNNYVAVPITLLASDVDLVVTEILVPSTATVGSIVPVTITVKNQGTGTASTNWFDYVELLRGFSTLSSSTVDQTDFSPLAPGATYTFTTNIAIPADTALGAASIRVSADDFAQQHESNNNNNSLTRSIQITAAVHDLSVSDVLVPTDVEGDEEVTVTWTGTNNGSTAITTPWVDRIWLSTDGTLAGAFRLLGSGKKNQVLVPSSGRSAMTSLDPSIVSLTSKSSI
ncbi:MAG: hypothetical protein EOP84_23240, partial [Verrucomicrobiaceae bacterium]